uniref:Uncharacterized protein n=1 Tax=Chromera velia CCMP2878 TaxID=1169474 RepID=A0A0G4H2V2_9ALVE|eukprot:Cvel_5617.t1-p1 / transcript=Cvel_5617.t1 / gene=Cvel_5617 / organism=Chromera_velia_CCMP2878 / gene_product=hypothetical protein / transcript_product=hypothetical protein / location=Cvel_scaffold264:85061-91050(+) / protein_length=1507 / sequence_SO=supercontig / SO=protein_coding / is_pseudo=false
MPTLVGSFPPSVSVSPNSPAFVRFISVQTTRKKMQREEHIPASQMSDSGEVMRRSVSDPEIIRWNGTEDVDEQEEEEVEAVRGVRRTNLHVRDSDSDPGLAVSDDGRSQGNSPCGSLSRRKLARLFLRRERRGGHHQHQQGPQSSDYAYVRRLRALHTHLAQCRDSRRLGDHVASMSDQECVSEGAVYPPSSESEPISPVSAPPALNTCLRFDGSPAPPSSETVTTHVGRSLRERREYAPVPLPRPRSANHLPQGEQTERQRCVMGGETAAEVAVCKRGTDASTPPPCSTNASSASTPLSTVQFPFGRPAAAAAARPQEEEGGMMPSLHEFIRQSPFCPWIMHLHGSEQQILSRQARSCPSAIEGGGSTSESGVGEASYASSCSSEDSFRTFRRSGWNLSCSANADGVGGGRDGVDEEEVEMEMDVEGDWYSVASSADNHEKNPYDDSDSGSQGHPLTPPASSSRVTAQLREFWDRVVRGDLQLGGGPSGALVSPDASQAASPPPTRTPSPSLSSSAAALFLSPCDGRDDLWFPPSSARQSPAEVPQSTKGRRAQQQGRTGRLCTDPLLSSPSVVTTKHHDIASPPLDPSTSTATHRKTSATFSVPFPFPNPVADEGNTTAADKGNAHQRNSPSCVLGDSRRAQPVERPELPGRVGRLRKGRPREREQPRRQGHTHTRVSAFPFPFDDSSFGPCRRSFEEEEAHADARTEQSSLRWRGAGSRASLQMSRRLRKMGGARLVSFRLPSGGVEVVGVCGHLPGGMGVDTAAPFDLDEWAESEEEDVGGRFGVLEGPGGLRQGATCIPLASARRLRHDPFGCCPRGKRGGLRVPIPIPGPNISSPVPPSAAVPPVGGGGQRGRGGAGFFIGNTVGGTGRRAWGEGQGQGDGWSGHSSPCDGADQSVPSRGHEGGGGAEGAGPHSQQQGVHSSPSHEGGGGGGTNGSYSQGGHYRAAPGIGDGGLADLDIESGLPRSLSLSDPQCSSNQNGTPGGGKSNSSKGPGSRGSATTTAAASAHGKDPLNSSLLFPPNVRDASGAHSTNEAEPSCMDALALDPGSVTPHTFGASGVFSHSFTYIPRTAAEKQPASGAPNDQLSPVSSSKAHNRPPTPAPHISHSAAAVQMAFHRQTTQAQAQSPNKHDHQTAGGIPNAQPPTVNGAVHASSRLPQPYGDTHGDPGVPQSSSLAGMKDTRGPGGGGGGTPAGGPPPTKTSASGAQGGAGSSHQTGGANPAAKGASRSRATQPSAAAIAASGGGGKIGQQPSPAAQSGSQSTTPQKVSAQPGTAQTPPNAAGDPKRATKPGPSSSTQGGGGPSGTVAGSSSGSGGDLNAGGAHATSEFLNAGPAVPVMTKRDWMIKAESAEPFPPTPLKDDERAYCLHLGSRIKCALMKVQEFGHAHGAAFHYARLFGHIKREPREKGKEKPDGLGEKEGPDGGALEAKEKETLKQLQGAASAAASNSSSSATVGPGALGGKDGGINNGPAVASSGGESKGKQGGVGTQGATRKVGASK